MIQWLRRTEVSGVVISSSHAGDGGRVVDVAVFRVIPRRRVALAVEVRLLSPCTL